MNIPIKVGAIINLVLSIVSFIPCLMAGVMSMDSPQATSDPLAIGVCCIFLTFPIVCLVCGILPFVLRNLAVYIVLIPIVEIILFFSTVYLSLFILTK
jgi:hypothetical protein